MKRDLIHRIKQAEEASEATVAAAEKDAQDILAKARQEATQIRETGQAGADTQAREQLEAARAAAQAEADKLLATGRDQAAAMTETFNSKVDGAAERVLPLLEGTF